MPKYPEIIDLTTPPRKRARYDSEATSSQPSQYSVAYSSSARSSSRASLRSFAESTPSDSPTNPFGLKRVAQLSFTLPEVSSFSQHLALRFQYVQCYASAVFTNESKDKTYLNDTNTLRRDREGVYRIVQVPLNYTFLHLHRLIFFLFGGMGSERLEIDEEDELELDGSSSSAAFLRNSRKRKRSSNSAFDDENAGHLFQVLKNVTMHSPGQKPGEIRKGTVWAKLSNTYDEDFDDDMNINPETLDDDTDMWRSEDDLPLSSVWPSGCTFDRGIVYSHSTQTQIHITINAEKIPPRTGRGNVPHIFRAKGLIRLPGYEKYLRRSAAGLPPETIDKFLDLTDFNALGAFEKFHKHASQVDAPLPSIDLPVDIYSSPATPLTHSSSPGPFGTSTPSSSHDYSSDAEFPPETSMRTQYSDAASDFPFAVYPHSSPASILKSRLHTDTPFPTSDGAEKRMKKLEKRIRKDTKKLEEKVYQMKIREAKERERIRRAKERRARIAKKLAEEADAAGDIDDTPADEEDQVDQLAEGDQANDALEEEERQVDQLEEEDQVDQLEEDQPEDEQDQLLEDAPDENQQADVEDIGEDGFDYAQVDDDREELSAAGIFPLDEYTREVESALGEPSPPSPAKNTSSTRRSDHRPLEFQNPLANPPHRLRLMKSRSAAAESHPARATEPVQTRPRRAATSGNKGGGAPLFATRAELEQIGLPRRK